MSGEASIPLLVQQLSSGPAEQEQAVQRLHAAVEAAADGQATLQAMCAAGGIPALGRLLQAAPSAAAEQRAAALLVGAADALEPSVWRYAGAHALLRILQMCRSERAEAIAILELLETSGFEEYCRTGRVRPRVQRAFAAAGAIPALLQMALDTSSSHRPRQSARMLTALCVRNRNNQQALMAAGGIPAAGRCCGES